MEWNYYKDKQPENGRQIVQVRGDDGDGHRVMGMIKYYQNCKWEDLMKYCEQNDLMGTLHFWWVYAEDFPFPDINYNNGE